MASLTLEKVLVVDLEATCDEPKPPGFQSEIIEIGVSVLDMRKGEIIDKGSTFITPVKSVITPFCTKLTTITQADVSRANGARNFAEAVVWLKKFGPKNKVWASWGDYDRTMFKSQCDISGVEYPFGPGHINVKTLMALFEGMNRGIGAKEAVEYYGLTWEGTHHRGIDDAVNIGRVLLELVKRYNKK